MLKWIKKKVKRIRWNCKKRQDASHKQFNRMVRWRDEMNDWQYWHENFFVVNFGYLYPTLEDYVKYKKRYNKWRVRHIAAFGVTDLDPQTKQEILINGWKK